MADHATLQDRLLSAARRTLLPRPFPARRDVEVAGALPASERGWTFFYDHLWPRPGCLAVVAARIPGDALDDALRAAGLQHLLRAALRTTGDPAQALALCRDAVGGSPPDIAIATLDTGTGRLALATQGCAAAVPAAAAEPHRSGALAAGSLVWLAAGVSEFAATGTVDDDPQALARDAAASADQAAVVLLSYKLPTRRAQHETLSLANDLADIPRVIVAFEEFCGRHGIAETAVAGINVALDEVLTNVVSYAFEDGAAHEIYVELQAQDRRLVIDVKDDGRPFDPLQALAPALSDDIEDRPIGGLGIHFVRSIVDDVRYRRADGWNIMTLEKTITAAPET
jgi:anti-sigma regulatory factor (Ser/Thr protein kinase)